MKIFTGAQIKELDKFTIENEPVASIDLMERAAKMNGTTERPLWCLQDQETTAETRWRWHA